MGEERCGTIAAKVTRQQATIDSREVDEHQSVEHVSERRIDVEANQACVELQVLPEQHWHSFAIVFEGRNESIRFIYRGRDRCDRRASWSTWPWMKRFHHAGQHGVEVVLLQK